MKKITAIALLLTLIAATYTKPMKGPEKFENLFKNLISLEIKKQAEKIKLKKEPDWNEFDEKVGKWFESLKKFGLSGLEAIATYREQIKKLKQTLGTVPPPTIPTLTTPPPTILPSQLTPLAVFEIDIQQLRSNLSEYFDNFLKGKIPIDQFTVKPFIEQVQKLEKDLPKVITQERDQIEKKLNRIKEGIGKLQITYVTGILNLVNKKLSTRENESMIQIIKTQIKTETDAENFDNNIVNKNLVRIDDYGIRKGLKGDIVFSDYFALAMKRVDKQYVIDFKTIVQNLRKTMVDDWEAILEIVKDDTKDKEMRKNLAWNAGDTLSIFILFVENVFAKYLDDQKAKFKSTKGNDHPYDDITDYKEFMANEAEKL